MKNLISVAIVAVMAMMMPHSSKAEMPVYLDDSQPIDARVEDALSHMTTEEKITMIHAQSKFSSPGVARLGIPGLWTTDGPHGIRPDVFWDDWKQAGCTNDSCTAFPALTCLAATWNPEMASLYGKSIGEEARYRGKDVLLGPGVNICRTPLNGRNFEYMGEDPLLASRMVVPYVKGVQQNGVAACVKHFALNNNEVNRYTTNVIVDDRTLREIYLPAFEAAVKEGGAWSIMGAYNLYKNQQLCHNQYLLNDILKNEWGFDGVVVSDWGGTHDTDEAIHNGLDLEFGTWTDGMSEGLSNAYDNYYLARPFLERIKTGKVGTTELDDKARRILRLIFRTSMNRNKPFGSFASPEHAAACLRIGQDGIVLLKNERNTLPLTPGKFKTIAVIGENAIKRMTVGGGSSSLKVKTEIVPLNAIINRFSNEAEIIYARGYKGSTATEYDGVKTGQDITDSRSPEAIAKEAEDVARKADCVVFIGGLNKEEHNDCEGRDRMSLNLPYGQDELITRLAKANPNIVVVNISGNPVAMPWLNDVAAVVQAWYLGSEAGNAIASVLAGDVNPSGKLPFTFPARLEDVGAHKVGEYPGVARNDGSDIIDCHYNEGLYVGYRGVDHYGTKPLFPFGHGLSYTTFSYGQPSLDTSSLTKDSTIKISVPVTNTGDCAGAEVVQLYISDLKSSLPRPIKELKGFSKLYLAPGETKVAEFEISNSMLTFYDDNANAWTSEPGKFEALIGTSSADIKARLPFSLK